MWLVAAELDTMHHGSVPPILTFNHIIQYLCVKYLLCARYFSKRVAYSNGQDR